MNQTVYAQRKHLCKLCFSDILSKSANIVPTKMSTYTIYHIAGNFGEVLIWRFGGLGKNAKLKTANIKPCDPDSLVAGLNHQVKNLPNLKTRCFG